MGIHGNMKQPPPEVKFGKGNRPESEPHMYGVSASGRYSRGWPNQSVPGEPSATAAGILGTQ